MNEYSSFGNRFKFRIKYYFHSPVFSYTGSERHAIRVGCVVVVGSTRGIHIAEVRGVAHIRRRLPPVANGTRAINKNIRKYIINYIFNLLFLSISFQYTLYMTWFYYHIFHVQVYLESF